MPDAHYDDHRLAALYDLGNGWDDDHDFYLALAGGDPLRILDIGCGTGILADAYAARGHAVTGADPSPAMLDMARRKPNADRITWVRSDAQSLDLDERFDLIVMTGHAFQTLLTDEDMDAAIAAMRRHLAPDGLAVFESRNPAIDWQSRWAYAIELDAPGGKVTETRELAGRDGDTMTFDLRYRFADGEELVSHSTLRFPTRDTVEAGLTRAGLRCEKLLGDWDSSPLDPAVSPEMIFHVRAAG